MIFVKYKIKYRKYHPVFGNTHAGLVFHTHVWFLPHIWKSLRYLVKTTHVRFLPNTFWGWRAVTSNIWLRLEKQQCWKRKLIIMLLNQQMGGDIYGSDSPGREFWPKCVTFLKKVEPSCDQTWWDIFDFSIDLGQLCPVDPRNTFVWPWKNF